MTPQELPLCCRQCVHKQSQYLYPSWSHRCMKTKPMVEGCNWKQARHLNFAENERARAGN